MSCIETERKGAKCAYVYKEATLSAAVGVDRSLERFEEDVVDRLHRHLPADMSQVEWRRVRSTKAIMKELRYNIFPAVIRFRE